MVTVCCVAIVRGAVYSPDALIDPGAPVGIDHVTAVLLVFETAAVNCWVPFGYKVTDGGATDTVIGGISVTVAVPTFVPSAWLVAVTMTVC
jgi:hypothetical protein